MLQREIERFQRFCLTRGSPTQHGTQHEAHCPQLTCTRISDTLGAHSGDEKMTLASWHYFLSLERDFERTIDFVELDGANSSTYSNEFAKLLLLIGSEVDVTAKALCRDLNPSSKATNILEYQKEICGVFQGMHAIEIEISRFNIRAEPWNSWGDTPPTSPPWWKAYNDVKHSRDANFPEANQSNVLHSLCGLLSLHLYLHRSVGHLQPYPRLLEYSFPEFLVTSGGKPLPGYN